MFLVYWDYFHAYSSDILFDHYCVYVLTEIPWLVNGCHAMCVVVVLQSIPVKEHYGSNFMYVVNKRQLGEDRWTLMHTLSSEMSSFRHLLGSKPVEMAIISKNEIGEALPSAVFNISLASVLCQFSSFFYFLSVFKIMLLSSHVCICLVNDPLC